METLRTIPVQTDPPYPIYLGEGLLSEAGTLLAKHSSPCRVMVVADSNVAPLYLSRVRDCLMAAGFSVSTCSFPAGESSKTLDTFGLFLESFAAQGLTRTDCIFALGGGVTGDLAGFAAGCYLRGIRFVQCPTSLLAMVDASVGGKTGLDLSAGKNLAGVFHQPQMVMIDPSCLNTLPKDIFADGMAEVVKTAMLSDNGFAEQLEQGEGSLSDWIAACVSYKSQIVSEDPTERGLRKLLNFGHTFGHAIERCSNYTISHGQAVSMGMVLIARAAQRMHLSEFDAQRLETLLQRFSLPTETPYSAAELTQAASLDKKRAGDAVTLVLPERFGACRLETVPFERLIEFAEAGLS